MKNSNEMSNVWMNNKPQDDWMLNEHERQRRLEEIKREIENQESLNNPTHDSNIETLKEEYKKLRMPWESSL